MERPERSEKDDAQKAKLIFVSLAVVVAVLLVWSFVSANNAKKERDAARIESETLKQDNAKLEQLLKEQNVVIDDLKKKVQVCESKAKKPAKKAPARKTTKSKKTK